jgi:hypothetical protein
MSIYIYAYKFYEHMLYIAYIKVTGLVYIYVYGNYRGTVRKQGLCACYTINIVVLWYLSSL